MADIPEVFNHTGAGFVTLKAGEKYPPPYKGWQLPENARSFQQAKDHAAKGGNVGILAGNGYIGLDQDHPAAFDSLELPASTTWETRPGRYGLRFKCSDVAEALNGMGKKADLSQLYLFRNGVKCGEVKLQRTYQVIPPSWKKLDGIRADYRLLDSSAPAESSLVKLLADLQSIGITFTSKLEANAAKLEQKGREAHQKAGESDEARTRRYAEAALRDEVLTLAGTSPGERNNQLNLSTYAMAQFVAAGVLTESEVISELTRAAENTGLDSEEILKTIVSALEAGKQHPREIPKPEEADALLLADDLRKKVNTDPGTPFEPKYTQALAVLQLANPAEYQRIMADLKGKTSIRDLKKAVKQASASMGAAKRRPKAEADGLKLEDVCNVEYDEKGDISSVTLTPTRAAATIMKALPLAMTKGEDDIYHFDGQIYKPDGARIVDVALIKAAGDAVDIKKLKEVLRRIRNALLDNPVTFDPAPYLLGCKNGVVDLRTGTIRDYAPEDLMLEQIDVAHDPAARCPVFMAFLESITPDPVTRVMLIDWFAATAIKEPLAYVLFLLGLGRNGKGIYEKILKRFFGQSAFRDMPLQAIEKSDFAASEFYRKRGWIASETGKKKTTIGTDFLKLTSGNGVIDGNRKNKGRIVFEPYFQTIVDTNTMPQIEDSSRGWIERFCKANLPYVFVTTPDPDNPLERERDPALFDKLTTAEEMSGILNLVIFRAKEIAKTKTITKRSGEEMFAEYADQSASVGAFLTRFCEYVTDGLDFWTPATPVYDAYKLWCGYKVGEIVDGAYFGKQLKKLCGGCDSKTGKDKDRKSIRLYKRLTFDSVKCTAELEAMKQSLSTGVHGKSTGCTQEDKSTDSDVYRSTGNMWINLYERFGACDTNNTNSPYIEEIVEKPVDTVDTVDINSKQPCGNEAPCRHPVDIPVDKPTMGKIDSGLKVQCAKCGSDLTGKGTVEKNGKIYCAVVGCGYPPRKAEAI